MIDLSIRQSLSLIGIPLLGKSTLDWFSYGNMSVFLLQGLRHGDLCCRQAPSVKPYIILHYICSSVFPLQYINGPQA